MKRAPVPSERPGSPAIGIMTTEFGSAADLMRRGHGAEAQPFATIEHPISGASADQLADRARRAVAQSAEILLASSRVWWNSSTEIAAQK